MSPEQARDVVEQVVRHLATHDIFRHFIAAFPPGMAPSARSYHLLARHLVIRIPEFLDDVEKSREIIDATDLPAKRLKDAEAYARDLERTLRCIDLIALSQADAVLERAAKEEVQ